MCGPSLHQEMCFALRHKLRDATGKSLIVCNSKELKPGLDECEEGHF